MIVDKNMADILDRIVTKQPTFKENLHDAELVSPVVCCGLINLYKETYDLETRVLITEFMQSAGYPWLRKLVMRDPTPVSIAA